MIVKMYKTAVLCLADDKEQALNRLQELGMMHVEIIQKAESNDRAEVEQAAAALEKAIHTLNARKKGGDAEAIKAHSGREIAEKTLELMDESGVFSKRLDSLRRELDRLEPWGEFSHESLEALRAGGVQVFLCAGGDVDLAAAAGLGVCQVISSDKGRHYFALIGTDVIDPEKLPLASLPTDMSLKDCREEMALCQREIDRIGAGLDRFAAGLDKVRDYQREVQERLDFLNSRDGMVHENEIVYIQGYVPAPGVQQLKDAALAHGWALSLTEPDHDDKVPTLIKTPKVLEISKPIFDFIGISPGYNEWDISSCFLFFFTIFFAMIIGDAGYGALFLTAALVCRRLIKSEKARLPLNLFTVLSIATIIWGVLGGCYFGVSADVLPNFMLAPSRIMEQLPPWISGTEKYRELDGAEIKDKNVQYLCFVLAVAHLSFARAWKIALYWKRSLSFALGQLGWGMLLWGNFFLAVNLIVYSGSFPAFATWIYIIGFTLVLLFSVQWKDIGNVLNFPFAIIGSFVDVLSYIRLFAVGLSSYYIAASFNSMGMMLAKISPWLIVFAILVIAIGHLLNIALAFMGVMVHGIRLNTLEFSNHMELQWLGIAYKPFKKQSTSNKEME